MTDLSKTLLIGGFSEFGSMLAAKPDLQTFEVLTTA